MHKFAPANYTCNRLNPAVAVGGGANYAGVKKPIGMEVGQFWKHSLCTAIRIERFRFRKEGKGFSLGALFGDELRAQSTIPGHSKPAAAGVTRSGQSISML